MRPVLTLVLLLIPAFSEWILWHPWPFWMYGVYAVAGMGILWGSDGRRDHRHPTLALFGIALLLLWLVPWSSRKSFLRDLRSLEAGMSRSQVEAVMAEYLVGTGWPASPWARDTGEGAPRNLEISGAQVFRHSTDSRFNSDWGVVFFEGDQVTKVEFWPD